MGFSVFFLINIFKFIVSYVYLALSSFYAFLFRVRFLKTKKFKNLFVISVGNITAGGSGKTPFVVLLSTILSKLHIKHAVISRGYKKKLSGNMYILPEKSLTKHTPSSFGDEPFMLFKILKKVPVFVGNKLLSLLKMQAVYSGRVALIDDGYQTHSLHKDLNILLLDCSLDLSLYKILPLGLLREPLKKIKNADVVVLTKTNLADRDSLVILKKHFDNFINLKKQKVFSSEYHYSVLVYNSNKFEKVDFGSFSFKDVPLVSICGIANPASFKKSLLGLDLPVLKSFIFSNHYQYSSKNTKTVSTFCAKNNIKTIITTKKDFYKIKPLFSRFVFYVIDVEHKIYDYEKFAGFFEKKLVGDFK